MPAYMIVDVEVTDPERYAEYRAQAVPLIQKFGGKFIARSEGEAIEGSWQPHRVIIVEFPDMAALKRWHDSPEYAPVKAIRLPASKVQMIAVDGV